MSKTEGVDVEEDALRMIARAAEGSARDGLSILDQAIAHGGGKVTAEQVRDMLGLADRGRIRRLLEHVLSGDAAATLADLDEAHDLGIDPGSLAARADGRAAPRHAGQGRSERGRASRRAARGRRAACGQLGWGRSTAIWQMLLKGLADVQVAPDPREAATMALLRIIHAADFPTPRSRAVAAVAVKGRYPRRSSLAAPAKPSGPTAQLPADLAGLIGLLEKQGKHQLPVQLHDNVGLVRYAPPELVLKPMRPLGGDWPRDLTAALKDATGKTWKFRFPTSRASLLCSTRRKWQRSAFAQKCWPIPRSRPRSKRSLTATSTFARRKAPDPCRLDLNKIMEMAQNAQAELQKATENLESIEVEGVRAAAS